ncbi:MAG: hypothetical protein HKN16_01255, partial [Saprospiraceae bacterium]|nr:hypothetical protein [Saprospiraceae bacterium]
MIYYIFKYPLNLALRVFFRRIFISHKERIPRGVPVVLAVNHPTAFIDPILIAVTMWPTLHFMLRGDLFGSRVARFFFDQIKTIPIFRARDGFASLRNNQEIMKYVNQKINRGSKILILAEGQATHEKKMRPIQKGAARMLFGAYDTYGRKDMVVVPVGINYTNSDEFRSEVMVDFGHPIPLREYLPLYQENPRKAINKMTAEISDGMRQRIIHVEKGERES